MPTRRRPYAAFNPNALFAAASKYGHTTKRAIAQHAGIDETALSRFSTGERAPQFETLALLLDAYGLKFSDIVTYKTERRLHAPRPSQHDTAASIEAAA